MRTLTKLSSALLLFAALLAFAPEAKADGVAIVTGGGGTLGGFDNGPFTLIGQNFTLSLGLNNGPGTGPYSPGQTVELRAFNLGLDLRGGPGVVNGVSYNTLSYLGSLSLSASLVLPPGDAAAAVTTFVVPFTLSGHLQACPSTSVFSGCAPGFVFDSELLGEGLATVTLTSFIHPDGTLRYSLSRVSYEIRAPTPEPATVLLLGTALAALGAGARRRRANRDGQRRMSG